MRSSATFLFFLLSTLVLTMADKASFVGKWKLIEAYDEEFQLVTLPEGDYVFDLKDEDSQSDNLVAYIKIGNNMRSTITFLDEADQGDNITVGGLRSTMMMPPEPLFRLESFLSNSLPKMNLVQKETADNGTLMVFTGMGKIVCTLVDV